MKQSISIPLILIASILFGCNFIESENNSDTLDLVDGSLLFSITYDSTEIIQYHSGFLLLLKTEKIYTNFNYPLVAKHTFELSLIDISVFGVDKNLEYVQPAEGPARKNIPLSIKNGIFELRFQYKSYLDKYSVQFSDQTVAITPIDVNFTKYSKFDFNF